MLDIIYGFLTRPYLCDYLVCVLNLQYNYRWIKLISMLPVLNLYSFTYLATLYLLSASFGPSSIPPPALGFVYYIQGFISTIFGVSECSSYVYMRSGSSK